MKRASLSRTGISCPQSFQFVATWQAFPAADIHTYVCASDGSGFQPLLDTLASKVFRQISGRKSVPGANCVNYRYFNCQLLVNVVSVRAHRASWSKFHNGFAGSHPEKTSRKLLRGCCRPECDSGFASGSED